MINQIRSATPNNLEHFRESTFFSPDRETEMTELFWNHVTTYLPCFPGDFMQIMNFGPFEKQKLTYLSTLGAKISPVRLANVINTLCRTLFFEHLKNGIVYPRYAYEIICHDDMSLMVSLFKFENLKALNDFNQKTALYWIALLGSKKAAYIFSDVIRHQTKEYQNYIYPFIEIALSQKNYDVAEVFLNQTPQFSDLHYRQLHTCEMILKNDLESFVWLTNTYSVLEPSITRHPFLVACQFGRLEMVKIFLDKGVPVDLISLQLTGLSIAIIYKQREIVEFLLARRASNQIICNGLYPFSVAASIGYDSIIQYFINQNQPVDQVDLNGNTALIYACENGHLNFAKELIRLGANINHQNNFGQTPLLAAFFNCQFAMVLYLLDEKANPDIHNNQYSALSFAISLNLFDIVKKLLDCGAILTNLEHLPSLLFQALDVSSVSILKLLVERGENIYEKNKNGVSLFYAACMKGNIDCINYLLTRKPIINPIDSYNHTLVSDLASNRPVNWKKTREIILNALPEPERSKAKLEARNIKRFKLLTHSMMLLGERLVNGLKVKSEGYNVRQTLWTVSKYLKIFSSEGDFSDISFAPLIEAFALASQMNDHTCCSFYHSIAQDRLTIIPGGFTTHTVLHFIQKDFFATLNTGAENDSTYPVNTFKISREKLDCKVIEEIFLMQKCSFEYYRKMFNNGEHSHIYKILDAKKTITEFFLDQMASGDRQITGNCTWSSVEQAVRLYIIIELLKSETVKQENIPHDQKGIAVIERYQLIFKTWLLFQRLVILENYITRSAPEELDLSVARDSFEQLSRMKNDRCMKHKLYRKLIEKGDTLFKKYLTQNMKRKNVK